MTSQEEIQIPKPSNHKARFWVETVFLFIVLFFSMTQLVRGAEDRGVYFTLIAGICGKIGKLKIRQIKNVNGEPTLMTSIDNSTFDQIDGQQPSIAEKLRRRYRQRGHSTPNDIASSPV